MEQVDTTETQGRAASGPNFTLHDNGITYLIVSAGGSAVRTVERVRAELELDRSVRVFPTPQAAQWLDYDELEALTGWRPEHRMPTPDLPTFTPPGCRALVSPATLNTLTKWAAGHTDNLALSLLCEAIGAGVEIRAEVSLSAAYARHPAVSNALETLMGCGVEVSRVAGAAGDHLLRDADH